MPYIRGDRRPQIEIRPALSGFPVNRPQTPGELNYLITRLCHAFVERHGTPSYADLNDVVGVLECAKQELYRRLVAPYEDECIQRNGDVLPEYASRG